NPYHSTTHTITTSTRHATPSDRTNSLATDPCTRNNSSHPNLPPLLRPPPDYEVNLPPHYPRSPTTATNALTDRAPTPIPPLPHTSIAAHGLRTIPAREQGGNTDIKQLSKGGHLRLPVDAPGALFSAGDAHYAQGDCETCGTAIEMNATLHVRFNVRKGEAARHDIRYPRFYRSDYYLPPEFAAPRRFYATTGITVTPDD